MAESGDHVAAEQALADLRRALATMEFADPTGGYTALDMCGKMVDSIAQVVALSKRAAILADLAEQAKPLRIVVDEHSPESGDRCKNAWYGMTPTMIGPRHMCDLPQGHIGRSCVCSCGQETESPDVTVTVYEASS